MNSAVADWCRRIRLWVLRCRSKWFRGSGLWIGILWRRRLSSKGLRLGLYGLGPASGFEGCCPCFVGSAGCGFGFSGERGGLGPGFGERALDLGSEAGALLLAVLSSRQVSLSLCSVNKQEWASRSGCHDRRWS